MCFAFCPNGCAVPTCGKFQVKSEGNWTGEICPMCTVLKDNFERFINPDAYEEPTEHKHWQFMYSSPQRPQPVGNLTPPPAPKTLLPISPALTDVSRPNKDGDSSLMPVDWVSNMMGPDFGQEIEQGLRPARRRGGSGVAAQQRVNGTEISATQQSSGCAQTPEIPSVVLEDSNSAEEDSDSDDMPLSVVLAREIQAIRGRRIAKLPTRASTPRIPQQSSKIMLALTSVTAQGSAAAPKQAIEPAEKPSTWTRFGRTYASVEAARRGSSAVSLGPAMASQEPQPSRPQGDIIDLTISDGEDSDADGETDDGSWDANEDAMFDFEMDEESDDDGESTYEPIAAEGCDRGDMEVDSDEDADFNIEDVHWTEARGLW